MTDLSNVSDGDLADALGLLRADLAPLLAREEAIKTEFKARNIAVAEGNLFRVTVAPAPRMLVDAKRLKKERPEIYNEFAYVSAGQQVVVRGRTGALAEEREAA